MILPLSLHKTFRPALYICPNHAIILYNIVLGGLKEKCAARERSFDEEMEGKAVALTLLLFALCCSITPDLTYPARRRSFTVF